MSDQAFSMALFDADQFWQDFLRLRSAGCAGAELAQALSRYRMVPMPASTVHAVDAHFQALQSTRIRIATTDPSRQPRPDECVVVYGQYPPTFDSLVIGHHAFKPVADFWLNPLDYDVVECLPCWQSIDCIVYINLESRPDRQAQILHELARLGAPLDRIKRLAGVWGDFADDPQLSGTIGALRSHLKACRYLKSIGARHSLVLEDDFGFIGNSKRIQNSLTEFFRREYGYDVCLLASSQYGPVEPCDDLVCITRQDCTNAAAYLISAQGIEALIPCFEEALLLLEKTGRILDYAVDRCWKKLQGKRFLLMNDKFGFQLPSFSSIENRFVAYLD